MISVMFHSAGLNNLNWRSSHVSVPLDVFKGKLDVIREESCRSVFMREAAEHSGEKRDRLVHLTFDDGYLDNWVHVYPLLRRAGWRGVVYVNPEFIDPGETPRPNLEDVWAGRCAEGDLPGPGFLNWAELELLDRSGVLAIGCHSMSHTWYPTGPEIVDFHRPGLDTPWLAWNARPDRKPFYLGEDQSGFVPVGTPIHRHGRSLGIRRYFPDPAQTAAVTAHVAARGGADFFAAPDWREQLLEVARGADQGKGRPETDGEMLGRFRHEIVEAKQVLETRLGHPVDHFCWPGGAYCDESWEVAAAAGFRTLTVKKTDPRRWHDPDPRLVRRISDLHRYTLLGRDRPTNDPGILAAACDREWGSRTAGLAMRVRKVLDAVGLVR
jgi:peptidoglycan/xylan/chitin deacetylase (PgdA/CDA1 family)